METLNKNGVSITQTPGEEKYVKCCWHARNTGSHHRNAVFPPVYRPGEKEPCPDRERSCRLQHHPGQEDSRR